jgi:hypothetical protein
MCHPAPVLPLEHNAIPSVGDDHPLYYPHCCRRPPHEVPRTLHCGPGRYPAPFSQMPPIRKKDPNTELFLAHILHCPLKRRLAHLLWVAQLTWLALGLWVTLTSWLAHGVWVTLGSWLARSSWVAFGDLARSFPLGDSADLARFRSMGDSGKMARSQRLGDSSLLAFNHSVVS